MSLLGNLGGPLQNDPDLMGLNRVMSPTRIKKAMSLIILIIIILRNVSVVRGQKREIEGLYFVRNSSGVIPDSFKMARDVPSGMCPG